MLKPIAAATLLVLIQARAAEAYVDLAPTLGKIVADSKSIALVEVVGFDPATQSVTLKPLRTLKGDPVNEPIINRVAPTDGLAPPAVRLWAAPGSRGVWFATKNTALVCTGPSWYQAKRTGTGWSLGVDRPDLPLAYCGLPTRLGDAVEKMVAGGTSVITAIVYGTTDVDTSFDLALGRNHLPGLAKVQRLRASLTMPQMVAATAQGDTVIGPGPADASDVPGLIATLDHPDATHRAEAAETLGLLDAQAIAATPALTARLNDQSIATRTMSAAALLRRRANPEQAIGVLTAALGDSSPEARRIAATATAFAGPAAAGLAPRLTRLIGDTDESVRAVAVQAINTLGPAVSLTHAKSAAAALLPLLDDDRWRVDAADALGRLGPAVRPVPSGLIKMLGDAQPAVRWAAVRAMAQIGGDEARPAVNFIKTQLPRGSEVEQYNMMIYLALLGPVAADAAPVIRANRIKNPVLPGATLWAIGDTTQLPWLNTDDRRGPGGGPGELARYMYAAYVHELGDRLKPAAASLANHLLAGTAGEVPEWGYRLLTADTAGSLATFTPKLTDTDRTIRQRAAVALGHMGVAALPARPAIEAAAARATDEREKRLMTWSLKQIPG